MRDVSRRRSQPTSFFQYIVRFLAEKLHICSPETRGRRQWNRHRKFKLAEIQKATSNFDVTLVIRESENSTIYKGIIFQFWGGNRTVAVKRYYRGELGEFRKEVSALSNIQNNYLLSLLGICMESSELIIVYEYMSNGNLADHLYSEQLSSSLSWELRLKICIDVARGLEFLHHGVKRLIHGHLQLANILLDQNMAAKLSGFAIANFYQTHTLSMCDSLELYDRKTTRYIDPYYNLTGKLRRKTDVYAFGMILLEVLCKRLPATRYHGKFNKEGETLRQWAKENFDISLKEQISRDSFDLFLDIVEACTLDDPRGRPDMSEVVLKLKYVLSKKQNGDTIRVPIEEPLFTLDPSVSTTQEDNEKEKHAADYSKDEQRRKSKGSKSVKFEEPAQKVDPTVVPVTEPAKADISSSAQRLFRQFSLDEIKVATKDFDPEMVCGKGGEAKVYKGNILVNDGTSEICVAVKRLKPIAADPKREIEMLSMMQHPNLVSLLGSCRESGERILIYEYMPNGSLGKYLQRTTSGSLSWEQRLNICIGAASGLEYLHTCPSKSGQGHIHRDVKPVNILLDENWVAKIADFGLAKKRLSNQLLSEIATKLKGTPGYYAPEYLYSGKVTRSVDVYAFGIVLFEVLCRKRPWAAHHADTDDSEDSDDDIVGDDVKLWARANIDNNIEEPISENCLEVFIDVAAKCFNEKKEERPIMSEVVTKLKYALELHTSGKLSRTSQAKDHRSNGDISNGMNLLSLGPHWFQLIFASFHRACVGLILLFSFT